MVRASLALDFRCLLIVMMSFGCASSSDSPTGEPGGDTSINDGGADAVSGDATHSPDSTAPDTNPMGTPDAEGSDSSPPGDDVATDPSQTDAETRDATGSDTAAGDVGSPRSDAGRLHDAAVDVHDAPDEDTADPDTTSMDAEGRDTATRDTGTPNRDAEGSGEADTTPGGGECDCEDYASCTVDSCVDGVCENSPDDSLCPEESICAGASGHGLTGCVASGASSSLASLGCDSPDAEVFCTLVEPSTTDGYEAFLGDDTYVRCDYGLAMLQATLEAPGVAFADVIPVSMQGRLAFDGDKLELLGLWSDLCVLDTCYPIPVTPFVYPGAETPTPGQLLSTGHQLQISPNSAEAWNAEGSALLLITNLSAPSTFLTSTVWSAGSPTNDMAVFTAWFRVSGSLDAASPARVCFGELFFSNGAAQALDTFLAPGFGHVVVSL